MTEPLRIGTRGSALAMTQARSVAEQITAQTGRETELVTITTKGDTSRASLVELGGAGVFVTALRSALIDGTVDVAVHSLKDLPTADVDGVTVAAVPPRADPRDALVTSDGGTLSELPPGSRIGTGSPRRAAQLHALGLGLKTVSIRGNVDTRIGLVDDGEVDAVVLALAGLSRIGRDDRVSEVLDPLQMLPAVGQGALAVECRSDDAELVASLRDALEDRATRAAIAAERSLLATLEAGCTAPVGALGEVALGDHGEEVWVRAVVAAIDGSRAVRMSATGPVDDAAALGARLAEDMIAEGASALLGERVA